MNVLNFYDKPLLVVGDIHGCFDKLFFKIKSSIQIYENSVIIVAGDCGFGFNKQQYYIDLLKKQNEKLKEKNIVLLFIRGNHDDPDYFNSEIISFSNIKCIKDYSVVITRNYTTLCVGGAISVDRTWRKDEEIIINSKNSNKNHKKLYWENEMPYYDEHELNVIKKNGIIIDSIITHTTTSFAFPRIKSSSIEWCSVDSSLQKDLKKEREIIDNIFNFYQNDNIKFCAYGHFHMSNVEKNYGSIFIALDCDLNIINPKSVIEDEW